MRAQPQGGTSRCASSRDHGGRLEAPLCHGHRGRSLWRPALSGPPQFTTLPGSIDLFLAFVSGTRSQFWASQTNVCAPHQCVMMGRHNSCAQFHLGVWLRSKGLDEQWSYGRCLIHSNIWTQPVCQGQLHPRTHYFAKPKENWKELLFTKGGTSDCQEELSKAPDTTNMVSTINPTLGGVCFLAFICCCWWCCYHD